MPRFLSAENKNAFASRLSEYVREAKLQRCLVVLHGGEPLLAGVDSIVEFAALLRETIGDAAMVDVALQTNGLLLTERALECFETADISVSLSLDGPKQTNDLHRTTRKGRSSFDRVLAAYRRLQKRPKVFAGVIAVVDPRSLPEELFGFFDDLKPSKLDFLLPDAHHERPPAGREENADLYLSWLVSAFDIWFDKYPHLPLRTFEGLLDVLSGLPSPTDAFGLGDVSLLTIETDGSYHDLDVLKVVGTNATRLTGTVADTSIADVAASAGVAAHRSKLRKDGLCATCQSCKVVEVCGGGSLPHRHGNGHFDNPTVYCREWFALIQHARQRIEQSLGESVPSGRQREALCFDYHSFELAENASADMDRLWSEALKEERSNLANALNLISGHDELIAALFELSTEEFDEIALRPGVIAWQRTLRTTSAGRAVFAVDGAPLSADPAYLKFLTEQKANTPIGLRVAEDDPWLRTPFGSAIIFEPNSVSHEAMAVVTEALAIIESWRPELYAEMCRICRAIQFVRDPSASPDKIVSFSDNSVPGALYVSVVQGSGLIDPYDLADSLIHEHRHQKLYLLERASGMVEATDDKVVSPWREDLRPPSGLLHAVFVFVELRRFWLHVRDQGPSRMKHRAMSQLSDTDANLEAAFKTLAHCPLTPAGRDLVAILDAARRQADAIAA